MHLKSIFYLLILLNFLLIVRSNDDGQWKKEDLPNKEEAMDDDEPVISIKNSDRSKKSLDLNSTQTSSVDDKKIDDIKNVKLNDTMARSSSNYCLDDLLDNKKDDDKEGRIMNSDDEMVIEKPRMNIQGFIPVVGLASAALGGAAVLNSATASKKRQRLFSSSADSFVERLSNNQLPSFNPNYMLSDQQNKFNRPERRRFSSTLQNLASSLTGSVNKLAKRKQVVDYSSFAQGKIINFLIIIKNLIKN